MNPQDMAEAMEVLTSLSPLPIIGLDGQGAVDVWNPAAVAIFGWNKEEVSGRRLPDAIGVFRESHFVTGVPVRAKDGHPLHFAFRTAARPSGGMMLMGEEAPSPKREHACASCSMPLPTPSSKWIARAGSYCSTAQPKNFSAFPGKICAASQSRYCCRKRRAPATSTIAPNSHRIRHAPDGTGDDSGRATPGWLGIPG